jgi:hypothetical protein
VVRAGDAIQSRALAHVVGNLALARQFKNLVYDLAATTVDQEYPLH